MVSQIFWQCINLSSRQTWQDENITYQGNIEIGKVSELRGCTGVDLTLRYYADEQLGWADVVLEAAHIISPYGGRHQPDERERTRHKEVLSGGMYILIYG